MKDHHGELEPPRDEAISDILAMKPGSLQAFED